jgi:hypothetical protein
MKTRKMTKKNLLQIILLTLAGALFLLSLSQPVWTCNKGGFPFQGFVVLAIGYMGLMFFNPAWFCNFILVVALMSVLRKSQVGPSWLSIVVSVLATTTLFGPYICGVTGGPLGEGIGPDRGVFIWVVSMWLASSSVLLAPAKSEPSSDSAVSLR